MADAPRPLDERAVAGRDAPGLMRAPSESIERLPGPDVVRAVALIGVVVMNYHGYLIIRGAERGSGGFSGFFDPFSGPLSTRFAATFVLTAGIGITLLTRRVVAERVAGVAGSERAVSKMRWRLVRRGMALYLLGLYLDVIWPGTIILYYGAMFVLASILFTLASRWIVIIGVACALAGWAINTWAFLRVEDGGSAQWLTDPEPGSIRRYVFDIAINGTHPLLPWLVFLCVGIVIGRVLHVPDWRWWAGGIGFGLFALANLVSSLADTAFQVEFLSVNPFDRGLVYVASALGTALMAVAAISGAADRASGLGAELLDPLRRAGQMTLTLYIAHILVFNLVVDWLGWIEPAGLGTALTFALVFWTVLITAGALWHRRFGRGPAERVYRAIGG